jgi:hypothetical protein
MNVVDGVLLCSVVSKRRGMNLGMMHEPDSFPNTLGRNIHSFRSRVQAHMRITDHAACARTDKTEHRWFR